MSQLESRVRKLVVLLLVNVAVPAVSFASTPHEPDNVLVEGAQSDAEQKRSLLQRIGTRIADHTVVVNGVRTSAFFSPWILFGVASAYWNIFGYLFRHGPECPDDFDLFAKDLNRIRKNNCGDHYCFSNSTGMRTDPTCSTLFEASPDSARAAAYLGFFGAGMLIQGFIGYLVEKFNLPGEKKDDEENLTENVTMQDLAAEGNLGNPGRRRPKTSQI